MRLPIFGLNSELGALRMRGGVCNPEQCCQACILLHPKTPKKTISFSSLPPASLTLPLGPSPCPLPLTLPPPPSLSRPSSSKRAARGQALMLHWCRSWRPQRSRWAAGKPHVVTHALHAPSSLINRELAGLIVLQLKGDVHNMHLAALGIPSLQQVCEPDLCCSSEDILDLYFTAVLLLHCCCTALQLVTKDQALAAAWKLIKELQAQLLMPPANRDPNAVGRVKAQVNVTVCLFALSLCVIWSPPGLFAYPALLA